MFPSGCAPDLAQVIRPLLPKKRPKDARDEPGALRSFPDAEKLLAEDARFLRTPARDRCAPSRCCGAGFCCDSDPVQLPLVACMHTRPCREVCLGGLCGRSSAPHVVTPGETFVLFILSQGCGPALADTITPWSVMRNLSCSECSLFPARERLWRRFVDKHHAGARQPTTPGAGLTILILIPLYFCRSLPGPCQGAVVAALRG